MYSNRIEEKGLIYRVRNAFENFTAEEEQCRITVKFAKLQKCERSIVLLIN